MLSENLNPLGFTNPVAVALMYAAGGTAIEEAMEKAAIQLGLSSDIARKLVLETAVGATKMALAQATKTPEQLRREVTSPGGTTEAAIKTLQNGDLAGLFDRAIASANARSIELAGDAS